MRPQLQCCCALRRQSIAVAWRPAHANMAPPVHRDVGRRMDTQIAFNAASNTAAARNREAGACAAQAAASPSRVANTKTCKCSSCKIWLYSPLGPCATRRRHAGGVQTLDIQPHVGSSLKPRAGQLSVEGRHQSTISGSHGDLTSHWLRGLGSHAVESETIARGAAACTGMGVGRKVHANVRRHEARGWDWG